MNKKIIISSLCLLLLISGVFIKDSLYSFNNQHTYNKKTINNYEIEYEKTFIGKNSDYEMKIGIAKEDGEFIGDMIQGIDGAISGINGAYFSPKAYGITSTNVTWSNRISNYKDYSQIKDLDTRMLLGINGDNKTITLNESNNNTKYNITNIKEGISNFPGLLKNNRNIIENWSDQITSKMELQTDKTFICTDDKENIYFGIIKQISIREMPNVLKKLGCSNALNLDAGASTSMIYNNQHVVKSWTPVMDGIFIVKKSGLTNKEEKTKKELKSGMQEKIRYSIYTSYQKAKTMLK